MSEYKSGPRHVAVPWNISDIILFVLALGAVNVAIGMVWDFFQWEYGNTTAIALSYLLQLILSFIAVWWFALRNKKVTRELLALRWLPFGDTLGYVIGGYIVYAALVLVIVLGSALFSAPVPGFEPQEPYIEIFGGSSAGIILLGVIAICIAPIVEELIFRVFILQTFAKKLGPWFAVIISSALFAGVHFEFGSFFVLFLLGCVMGYLFISKRSLPLSVLFHMFNNAIALIVELTLR